MGGGDSRDREDRSDEYRDREPGGEQEDDAQRRLAESGDEENADEGSAGGENGGSRYYSPLREQAESASATIADPEDHLEALPDTIDRSVVEEHTTTTPRARQLHAVMQGWLIEERDHDAERVMAPAGTDADGLEDIGFWWSEDGYWSEGVEPVWETAADVIDRDAETAEAKPLSKPGQSVEYDDEVENIMRSAIGFSQAFADKHFADDDGKITVHRRWEGDMADDAREAKETDTEWEVDPRALESNSLSGEKLRGVADEGDVIATREIDVEEVGIYLAAIAPNHANEEEITTLGHETYNVQPDQIEVIDETE